MTVPHLLITGASSGIAQAAAAQAKAKGWKVLGAGRQALGDEGFSADLSTSAGVRHTWEWASAQWGQAPSHLLHAVGNIRLAALERTSDEQWDEVLRVNLSSAFYALRAFSTALKAAQQPGAAVLFGSTAARIGTPAHAAVAAAKGGIEALVRAAAADNASASIRINALAPGLTDTPLAAPLLRGDRARAAASAQYPLGRIGRADELAAAALWLLGDDSGWITGQVLPVDGGFSSIRPLVKAPA